MSWWYQHIRKIIIINCLDSHPGYSYTIENTAYICQVSHIHKVVIFLIDKGTCVTTTISIKTLQDFVQPLDFIKVFISNHFNFQHRDNKIYLINFSYWKSGYDGNVFSENRLLHSSYIKLKYLASAMLLLK